MPISTTGNRISYTGNGVTTDFSFPYLFFSEGDLVVVLIDDTTSTTQVLNTDYTVSGVGTPDSGEVAMIVAPAADETLLIYRDVPYTQEVDYIEGDSFPAETHETALDKLTVLCQQLLDETVRSFRLPPDYAGDADPELPTPEALSYLRWNSDATALENTTSVSSVVASDVPFTATGGISSTNVQAAIAELDSEKQNFDADIPTVSASQAEMEAGTEAALRSMSPIRVAQAISALSVSRFLTRYNNSTETLTSAEMNYITVAALSGDITKTLPASTGLSNGTIVGFKVESTSGHLLTVTAGGSDNIDWGYGGLSNTFRMSDSDDMVLLSLNKTNALWEVILDRMSGPYFKATRINSSQSIGTATFTKCRYNTFSEDSHDNYDETTNFRFTPELEGIYKVKCACFVSGNSRAGVALYKNGSLYEWGSRTQSTSDQVLVGSWEVYLNGSTDYIEIFAQSNDAAGTFASAVTIESYFKARRDKK